MKKYIDYTMEEATETRSYWAWIGMFLFGYVTEIKQLPEIICSE